MVGEGLPHLPAVLSASKSYSERLFRYVRHVRIDRLTREDADRATPAEQGHSRAMAVLTDGKDAGVNTARVADRVGRKPSSLSPARDSLIEKGLVCSVERGQIAFTVSHFSRFLLDRDD